MLYEIPGLASSNKKTWIIKRIIRRGRRGWRNAARVVSASAKPPRERGMLDTTLRHNSFLPTLSQSACNSRDKPPFWARFTIQGVELRNLLLWYIVNKGEDIARNKKKWDTCCYEIAKQSLNYWPDFKLDCYLQKQGVSSVLFNFSCRKI